MEPVASNIQVLLQAAEFLERRERGEAQSLAGFQAAISLTRARAGLGFQLEGWGNSPGEPPPSTREGSVGGRAGRG